MYEDFSRFALSPCLCPTVVPQLTAVRWAIVEGATTKSFQLSLIIAMVGVALNGCSANGDATTAEHTPPPRPLESSSKSTVELPGSQALPLEGTWSGDVLQGGVGVYSVRISFSGNADETKAVVEYPELGCGGLWATDSASGNVHSFTEVITYGKGSCVTKAQIEIDATDATKIEYEVLPPYPARATLTRDAGPAVELRK